MRPLDGVCPRKLGGVVGWIIVGKHRSSSSTSSLHSETRTPHSPKFRFRSRVVQSLAHGSASEFFEQIRMAHQLRKSSTIYECIGIMHGVACPTSSIRIFLLCSQLSTCVLTSPQIERLRECVRWRCEANKQWLGLNWCGWWFDLHELKAITVAGYR